MTTRLNEGEDHISGLEDEVQINIQVEQQNEKRLRKYEDSLMELQDNMKHNNICIIGIPEGEEKEQGIENLSAKIITENFPNLDRGKAMKVQEAQRVPIKRNPNRPTSRHITIKMAKFQDKERIIKAEGKNRK